MTDGFDVFVHDVIDAMTTAPCGRSYVTRPSGRARVFVREPRGGRRKKRRFLEGEEGGAESLGFAAAVGAGADGWQRRSPRRHASVSALAQPLPDHFRIDVRAFLF